MHYSKASLGTIVKVSYDPNYGYYLQDELGIIVRKDPNDETVKILCKGEFYYIRPNDLVKAKAKEITEDFKKKHVIIYSNILHSTSSKKIFIGDRWNDIKDIKQYIKQYHRKDKDIVSWETRYHKASISIGCQNIPIKGIEALEKYIADNKL